MSDWPGPMTDAGCEFVTLEGEGGAQGRAGDSMPSGFGFAPDDTPRIEGPGEAATTVKKTGVWESGGG